jgi:hypothetical protein
MKVRVHKFSLCIIPLLILAGSLLMGCTGGPSPKMDAQIKGGFRYVGIAFQLCFLSSDYYDSCGRWPTTVEELHTFDSTNKDVERKMIFSDVMANIPWGELSNRAVFKTTPDGKLTLFVPYLGPVTNGDGGKANGDSFSMTGGEVTLTLDIPKPHTNAVSVESLIINGAETSVTLDNLKPGSKVVSTNSR